jgi:hypothetical protein
MGIKNLDGHLPQLFYCQSLKYVIYKYIYINKLNKQIKTNILVKWSKLIITKDIIVIKYLKNINRYTEY